MNILFLNTSHSSGGAAIAASRIAKAVEKKGFIRIISIGRKTKSVFFDFYGRDSLSTSQMVLIEKNSFKYLLQIQDVISANLM